VWHVRDARSARPKIDPCGRIAWSETSPFDGSNFRRTAEGRPGSAAETYRRYLSLPPWPGPVVMSLGFKWEQSKALAGTLTTGTSLFAVARRFG
jgi:hypothetical protein